MARAYFRSGQKNEAADTASTVLRRYPYSIDANRILVEILGVDRPENSQLYRQRVIELDPYAAQVSGTIFQANEVGDAAVTLDHLEWSGQPAGMKSDWDSSKAISLESGRGTDAQPDWLRSGGFADAMPAQSTPKVVPPLPATTPTFDMPASSASFASETPAQPTPEADIPDFLRAAGWGESTGSFDESKSMFADEPAASKPASDALPIEQGDMPDWLKAMAPPQAAQPSEPAQPAEDEVLPDWINNIGKSTAATAAASAASDEFDWLNPTDTPSQPQAQIPDEQPDWMNQLDQPSSAQSSADDQPDWMKGFGDEPAATPALPADDQPDWMKQLSNQSTESISASSMPDEFDFLNELTAPTSQPSTPTANVEELGKSQNEIDDSLAWLENLAAKQGATEGLLVKPEDRMDKEPDWVQQVKSTPQQPPVQQPAANVEELGKSQNEIDDSLAWLENLAAKQGATEGLLVKPEDRMDKEPDWVQQVKSTPQSPAQPAANVEELGKSQNEIDDSLAWLENLAAKQGATEGLLVKPEDRMDKEPDWVQQVKSTPQQPPVQQPTANVEELGKSQNEIDDSLAWLENLAAKQGATEGLLVKPEDRMEKEPDWVQQVKSTPQSPAQPTANVEELGKSQNEIDDSLAWLENLAAKQGATEGLLVKPEDRMEKEPDWVQQVKSTPQQPPVQQPAANVEELGKSQNEIDDSLAWLENLAAKQGATEGLLVKPEDRMEKEPDWVQQVKSTPQVPAEPVTFEQQSVDDTAAWLNSLDEEESKPESVSATDDTAMWLKSLDEPEPAPVAQADDMPAWLQGIDEEQAPVAEAVVPEKATVDESDWMNEIEEQTPVSAPVSEDENIPSWLKGIDEEESKLSPALPQDDLPAWMRDETGEVVAEPTKIQPTRPTDWQPIDEKQPEPPAPQPVVYEQPKPEPVAPVQEKPKPAPVKKAAPKPAEVKPATPPAPYREPLTQRGTGMLTMPIDPVLGSARNELSRSNIPGALETYSKLIKKGRFLDEVIFDLREALYRYPVEVSIWQSLGDAYMRANRLQDALDAYTKAEELLR